MRKLWILACVLALPCVASAQWEDLNRLQAGQKIQVVEVNSKKDSGTFLSVSDKTISLQAKSGQQIIQRQDVGSVKLMENKHRLRNTAIGGVLGAGVGAGIGAAAYRECNPRRASALIPSDAEAKLGFSPLSDLRAAQSWELCGPATKRFTARQAHNGKWTHEAVYPRRIRRNDAPQS